jgi:hypothetical protein
MSVPHDAAIARVYRVHPRQVSRWRDKGFDILDPAKLAESLASQHRPGKTLNRLLEPGALDAVSKDIHNLLTTPKS